MNLFNINRPPECFQSPKGRIHQASRRILNNQNDQLQSNHHQRRPNNYMNNIAERVISRSLESTNEQQYVTTVQFEPNIINILEVRSDVFNRNFPLQNNQNPERRQKPISRLILNKNCPSKRYVTEDRLLETEKNKPPTFGKHKRYNIPLDSLEISKAQQVHCQIRINKIIQNPSNNGNSSKSRMLKTEEKSITKSPQVSKMIVNKQGKVHGVKPINLKNEFHSKFRRHRQVKKKKEQERQIKQAIERNEMLQIPGWFSQFTLKLTEPQFPYLSPELIQQVKKYSPDLQGKTRNQELERQLRNPKQLRINHFFDSNPNFLQMISNRNNNGNFQVKDKQSYEFNQFKAACHQKTPMETLCQSRTPMEQLRSQYPTQQIRNKIKGKVEQSIDSLSQPKPNIFQQPQINIPYPILVIKTPKKVPQKLFQNNFHQNPTIPSLLKEFSNLSKFQNQSTNSTNDKSSAQNESQFSKIKKLKSPLVSQFKIMQKDKPYTKKYNVKIDNYQCAKMKWFWIRFKQDLKKNYSGELHFQNFTCYLNVHQAIINDLLSKQKKLSQFFKDSKNVTKKLQFSKSYEESFDSELQAVLLLPLKLHLPQGYDYEYSQYYGGKYVYGLSIFNKFAKVSFKECIEFQQRCQNERNLRNKIRFDDKGICIGSKVLKKRFQFTYYGSKKSLKLQKDSFPSLQKMQSMVMPSLKVEKEGQFTRLDWDRQSFEVYGEFEWYYQKPINYGAKIGAIINCLVLLFVFVYLGQMAKIDSSK